MNPVLTLERLCVGIVFILSFTFTAGAQVHVDSIKNVGVGTNSTAGAQMQIFTDMDSVGLNIDNSTNTMSEKKGLVITLNNNGNGIKTGIQNAIQQNSSSSLAAFGINNSIVNEGSGLIRGLFNIINKKGQGERLGIVNQVFAGDNANGDVTGIYNYCNNSTMGRTEGMRNWIAVNKTVSDPVFGIYNHISSIDSIGINHNVSGIASFVALGDYPAGNIKVRGFYSSIGSLGDYKKYGLELSVIKNNTATEPVYGILAEAETEGGNIPIYGIQGTAIAQADSSSIYGVRGYANFQDGTGLSYGVYGQAVADTFGTSYGIYGTTAGSLADSSYAGFFDGRVFTTATYSSLSDMRVKKNIEVFSRDATALIKMFRPVIYEFDHTVLEAAPHGKQFGFIAQEMESIIPEVVSDVKIPGKTIYETVTEEVEGDSGNTRRSTKVVLVGEEPSVNRKALNYEALIPILVKAIQEQQTEMEAYQVKIDAQQSQIILQNKMIAELITRMETLEKNNKN